MNLFRLAFTLSGLALLGGGLSSCLKEPEYSTTPEISFDNIRVNRSYPLINGQIDPKGQPTDTVTITLRYQDGDGDLGLNQSEVDSPPYKGTRFANNYFVQPLIKNPQTRKYEAASFTDNGTFDHITTLTDDKKSPIKGTLVRKLFYNYGDLFTAGQTVRFQISIVDRALHESNVVTTDSIVIKPR